VRYEDIATTGVRNDISKKIGRYPIFLRQQEIWAVPEIFLLLLTQKEIDSHVIVLQVVLQQIYHE